MKVMMSKVARMNVAAIIDICPGNEQRNILVSTTVTSTHSMVLNLKYTNDIYSLNLGMWWTHIWWSTEIDTTEASLNPRITSASSDVGKNSRPVINVAWDFATFFKHCNDTLRIFNRPLCIHLGCRTRGPVYYIIPFSYSKLEIPANWLKNETTKLE